MDRDSLEAILTGVPLRDFLILLCASSVAGFFGACGAVSFYASRRRRIGYYVIALMLVGMICGAMTGLLLSSLGGLWGLRIQSLEDVAAVSMVAGFVAPMGVLIASAVIQITLAYSNFQVIIKLERQGEHDGE
jgi:hypothetical protein